MCAALHACAPAVAATRQCSRLLKQTRTSEARSRCGYFLFESPCLRVGGESRVHPDPRPAGSAAHSVRTARPGVNSDVSTRPRSTVGIRLYRREQRPTPLQTIARAALRLGADFILLFVAALSVLFGERRSSVQSTSTQRFFALPLPFRRRRASSVTCLRAREHTPSQRALLVWVGRHLLVLRLRTVGAIVSSCNRWCSRSWSCNSVSSAFK